MSLPADPQIGFVGLGNMGKFMAINLAHYLSENKKPALRVWNRTSSKGDEVAGETNGSAVAVKTLAEIANSCDVIFLSLANDGVVTEVVSELLKHVRKGNKTVFVEMSTIYPTLTSEWGRVDSE
jgi:3-hydroxyisobutyrate dehydrogenase-like beta-hydroxyacid dehydrogenase